MLRRQYYSTINISAAEAKHVWLCCSTTAQQSSGHKSRKKGKEENVSSIDSLSLSLSLFLDRSLSVLLLLACLLSFSLSLPHMAE